MPKDPKDPRHLIEGFTDLASRIPEEILDYPDAVQAHLRVVEKSVGGLNAAVEAVASFDRATAQRVAKNIALGRS